MLSSITVLSGGTGSAKFIRGLSRLVSNDFITVIANVGDNFWFHDLLVCPDIDTITYMFAGILDERRGWGIRRDSFHCLSMLRKLGYASWFNIGDTDLAVHVARTEFIRKQNPLSKITTRIAKTLGVKARILPATDSDLQTFVLTKSTKMHLQEFWVQRSGRPAVVGINYMNAEIAEPAPGVIEAIEDADVVMVSPANPVTSVGPILAVNKITKALEKNRKKVIGVSPIIGREPVSGPAGKFLKALGYEVSSLSVAKLYRNVISSFVIHHTDAEFLQKISELGVRCFAMDIIMKDARTEKTLAQKVLRAATPE